MSYYRVFRRFLPLLLLVPLCSFGQVNRVPNLKFYDDDPLHFGFILAANQMNFIIKHKENIHQIYYKGIQIPERDMRLANIDSAIVYGIKSSPNLGFTVGIVGDQRLGEFFNFRFIPSLSFGSRELVYDTRAFIRTPDQRDSTVVRVLTQKINSTYVEFPFFIKYKSRRVHNFRSYVIGGLKYSFDLASQARKTELFNYEPKLFQSDSYYILGVGSDIYMNWFKFGIELSMSYGMRDMLLRENNLYTNSIESLRSKIFMLTFTFE